MANRTKRVVAAKCLSFPDEIEVQFHPVDETGSRTGRGYYLASPEPMAWDSVQLRFCLDPAYADECEGYFRDGRAAIIMSAQEFEAECQIKPVESTKIIPNQGHAGGKLRRGGYSRSHGPVEADAHSIRSRGNRDNAIGGMFGRTVPNS